VYRFYSTRILEATHSTEASQRTNPPKLQVHPTTIEGYRRRIIYPCNIFGLHLCSVVVDYLKIALFVYSNIYLYCHWKPQQLP